MNDLVFQSANKAKKATKLSYLGGINISAKVTKSTKVNHVLTYILYLAPASESGYNVCSHSTPECRMGCLASSGRVKMERKAGINTIQNARIKKTKLFHENNEFFMDWLINEINTKQKYATNKDFGFAVRLNGTSDIDWKNVKRNGKNIFETFPNVDFYDYTKNPNKFFGIAPNYHLTLSYTGYNWDACKTLLNKGKNVAMVFNINKNNNLPKKFNGYDVIDGDITDLRIKDKNGIIVGLHWKDIANVKSNIKVKNSAFCIQENDERNEY